VNTYIAVGRDARGRVVEQPIPAEDRAAALRVVSLMNFQAESLREPSTGKNNIRESFEELRFLFGRSASRMTFWRIFARKLRAGQPSLEAMQVVVEQNIEARFRSILQAMLAQVSSGNVTVASAMERYVPEAFTAGEVALMKMAENKIPIADAADDIVRELEEQKRHRMDNLTALAPSMVTAVLAVIVGLGLAKSLPQAYKPIFDTWNISFPTSLQFLVFVSNLALSWWTLLFLIIAGGPLLFGIRAVFQLPIVRRWWGTIKYGQTFPWMLLLPLGRVWLKRDRASLCRWYAMLLKPGKLNFLDATEIVAKSIESEYLRERLNYIIRQMNTTRPSTADAIRESDAFDEETTSLLCSQLDPKRGPSPLAPTFEKRAEDLRREADVGYALALPMVQVVGSLPAMAVTFLIAISVLEPTLKLMTNIPLTFGAIQHGPPR
jgi:type II secretory pathway component PulF